MRILLVGHGSFIARAVLDEAQRQAVPVLSLPHNADLEAIIQPGDGVVNFAIAPGYISGPYQEELDCDLRAARAATRQGAHFVMLSTRRVYAADEKWGAHESLDQTGDETFYGKNKAISEKKVLEACDGCTGIFRLSNIFGYEYSPSQPRRSFLGILLASLKQKKTIFFDMSSETRRDFLPVELCARLLLERARDHTEGIYNLGSGIAVRCGQLADWICEGFGEGTLICDPDEVKDEFFLDMEKWRIRFDLPIAVPVIKEYCLELGRKVKCEKY